MKNLVRYSLASLLFVFFALFLLGPIWGVAAGGFDLAMFREVFRSSIYVDGLVNALTVALVTTLICFIIALPLALLYDRYEFPGKKLTNLFILAPMILPPFVGALGYQQILGYYGIINSILTSVGLARVNFLGGDGRFWAICVVEALHLYPILYLNLITALGNVDPSLVEAARNLGAGRWRRLREITLPLIRPGIFAGGSIILIWSFTELGTPLMFNFNRITPVQVFNGLQNLERNPLPLTLVLIMLLSSALLYVVGKLLLGRSRDAMMTKGIAGSGAKLLRGGAKFLPGAVFFAVTALAILPHITLILIAFSGTWYGTILPRGFTLANFTEALGTPMVVPSIINSLQYSLAAMVIAVAAGTLTAIITVRWKLKGSWLLDSLAMLPLAVPGIVMAFGFLVLTYRNEYLRLIFDVENNPFLLLAVAYAVRRLPYVVRAVSSGLEQTPEDLELAARNLGATALATLRRITAPLIYANLLVGALFAFSFSMIEVSDSLILAQKEQFYPITKAIYSLWQVVGAGTAVACAFGVWTMLFLAATLALTGTIMGRKIGAIFRL